MTTRRYLPKDYEFTIRILDNGVILSSAPAGVLLAFSDLSELFSALSEFAESGKGLIGDAIRKGHACKNRKHKATSEQVNQMHEKEFNTDAAK